MSAEWSELSDYLAGVLGATAEDELERELFDDPAGSSLAASFLAVVDGIAELHARSGTLSGALSPAALDALRARVAGLVEIDLEDGATATCVIGEGVSLCVGHLRLPDPGVRRVDVEYVDPTGAIYARANDVPIDHEGGRVSLACETHVALMHEVATFRLVTRTDGARRVLGTYAVRNVLAPA